MTILSESVVKVGTLYGFIGLFVIVVFIVLAFALARYDYLKVALCMTGLAIITIFVVVIFCTEPHKRIKAILEDDYPAARLYEEYDVEGRDGDIWILTEKEPMEKKEE